MKRPTFALTLLLAVGCATTTTPEMQMGVMSDITISSRAPLCEHKVPGDVCVLCHPELAAKFKAVDDWCGPHHVPESQCFLCHSDLSFEPLPEVPEGADVKKLSASGEDVGDLAEHAVAGKVTVFDFYAPWCGPCRRVDAHILGLVAGGKPIAYRKLNVGTWETPIAKRHLADVPSLPYVVVYGADRKRVAAIVGLDLAKLDQAIADGAAKAAP